MPEPDDAELALGTGVYEDAEEEAAEEEVAEEGAAAEEGAGVEAAAAEEVDGVDYADGELGVVAAALEFYTEVE